MAHLGQDADQPQPGDVVRRVLRLIGGGELARGEQSLTQIELHGRDGQTGFFAELGDLQLAASRAGTLLTIRLVTLSTYG